MTENFPCNFERDFWAAAICSVSMVVRLFLEVDSHHGSRRTHRRFSLFDNPASPSQPLSVPMGFNTPCHKDLLALSGERATTFSCSWEEGGNEDEHGRLFNHGKLFLPFFIERS